MDVAYLIQMLSNKLVVLNNAQTQATMVGDLDTINSLQTEILGVQSTLSQLKFVQEVTAAATAANITPAQVVANGFSIAQTSAVIPSDPTGVLALYDLSRYASDPLYLHKITDILSVMPIFVSATDIDNYINNEAIGSPLTGAIILAAAQQYSIDVRLLMAMLELESNFGTAGVAVSTLNPGNVGNTGTSTRTYNSWQDGVAAVAQWLSIHPATGLVVDSTIPTVIQAPVAPVPMDPSAFVQNTPVVNPPVVNINPNPLPAPVITPDPSPAPSSTPPVIDSSPSSTSTPPSIDPINTETSTPETIIDSTATTTPPVILDPTPTSTPQGIDPTASSTPLSMGTRKKKRMIV